MSLKITILQVEATQRFLGLGLERDFKVSYVCNWDKAIELAQNDALDGFLFNLPPEGLSRLAEFPHKTRLFCIISPGSEPPFIPQDSPPLVFLPSPFSLLELRSTFRRAFVDYEIAPLPQSQPENGQPEPKDEAGAAEPELEEGGNKTQPTGLALSPRQFSPAEDAVTFSPIQNTVMDLVHTVKNPLVSIQTFAQMLPEKIEDKEFRESFSSFVNNELSVINGKLNSYLETISLPALPAKEFDLVGLLEQVKSDFAARYPQMETRIKPGKPLLALANQDVLLEAVTTLWSVIFTVVKKPREFLICYCEDMGKTSLEKRFEIYFSLKFEPQYIDMELDFLSTAKRSKGVEILHAMRLIEEMDGVLKIVLEDKERFIVKINLPVTQRLGVVSLVGS